MLFQFVILKKTYELKTQHFIGLPPEITKDEGSSFLLPMTKFLLLIEEEDGFYLYRYSLRGEFAGDSYHGTFVGAKEQAKYEFNVESESQWISIPASEEDKLSYVINYYRAREERRKER